MEGSLANTILLKDVSPNGSLKVLESFSTPSATDPYNGSVLAVLDGPVFDYAIPTRNERLYEEDLCDDVINSDYVKELVATNNFLGEADHPMKIEDRLDVHYPYVSHAITNIRKVEDEKKYYATFHILDTPNGRILKTLVDYGTVLGASSRGAGSVKTKSGKVVVDKDTYRFVTFDIVHMPGNTSARLLKDKEVTNESIDTSKYVPTNLSEQVNTLLESNNIAELQSVKPVLNFLNSTDNSEVSTLLNKVNEALDSTSSITNTDEVANDLIDAYSKVDKLTESVQSKDLIIDELTKEVSKANQVLDESLITNQSLEMEVALLNESVSELKSTIKSNNDKYSNKYNRLLTKLDESINTNKVLTKKLVNSRKSVTKLTNLSESLKNDLHKSRDLVRSLKSINSNLSESYQTKLSEVKLSNKSRADKYNQVKSDYNQLLSESVKFKSEYLRVRCNQLGINHNTVINALTESLDTISYNDLNKVISSVSRKKLNSTAPSYVLSESVIIKSNRNSNNTNKSENELTSLCRSVKDN